MLNQRNIKSFYIEFSLLATLGFCVPMFLFIYHPKFSSAWVLYIGNFILLGIIFISVILYNQKNMGDASLGSIIMSGIKITFLSIACSCIILTIILLLDPHAALTQAPANTVGNTQSGSLRSMLFLDATIVNIFVGAFASLIAAVTVKRYQKIT